MPRARKLSTRRVSVAGKVKPDLRDKLMALAEQYGEPRISSFVSIILESFAKGLYPCPTCKYPHPLDEHRKENHHAVTSSN